MQPLARVTDATLDVLQALRANGSGVWGLLVVKESGRPAGSVYPILERLEGAGWITSAWESDDARPGPRRRLYEFTPDGAAAAAELLAARATSPSRARRTRPRLGGEPA